MVGNNIKIEPQDHSDFIICLQKALIILKEEQGLFNNSESSKEDY